MQEHTALKDSAVLPLICRNPYAHGQLAIAIGYNDNCELDAIIGTPDEIDMIAGGNHPYKGLHHIIAAYVDVERHIAEDLARDVLLHRAGTPGKCRYLAYEPCIESDLKELFQTDSIVDMSSRNAAYRAYCWRTHHATLQ